MRTLLLICVAFVTLSCAPIPPIDMLADPDIAPPFVVSVELLDPQTLEVAFDEPVRQAEPHANGNSELGAIEWSVVESTAKFVFEHSPSPGTESFVEAEVEDMRGNSLLFVARFYGRNPSVPSVVINELTTQGSASNPDIVELAVLSDGNLAGVTLMEGTPDNWDQRIVLPDLTVAAGDFVVVHFKPQGIPEEIDELSDKGESGGINATEEAWDLWVPDGSGLSGNNGVISLTRDPFGGYLDAFVYSNRTSASDTNYAGFGSTKVLERATAVAEAGMWVIAGESIAPEDAVDPEPSTATRSMARDSLSTDTNHRNDWHITPTSGISPGAVNTDEEYEG